MSIEVKSFKKFAGTVVLSAAMLFSCGDDGNPANGGGGDSFRDSRDGKTYRTVVMPDGKTWMAQNLNFATPSGSWCYDDSPANCNTHGRLYDWATAIEACPAGWRLPTNSEWETLVDAVGGSNIAGTKLKASRGWEPSLDGDLFVGTDNFGFTALPGGTRIGNGGIYRAQFTERGAANVGNNMRFNNAKMLGNYWQPTNNVAQMGTTWQQQTQLFGMSVSSSLESSGCIAFAEVLGDGEGRPDRIRLGLMGGDISASTYDDMIQGVRLVWPPNVQGGVPAADSHVYEVTRATTWLRFGTTTATTSGYEMIINIAGLTAPNPDPTILAGIPLPTGYTSISGTGMGVVSVMIGDADVWNGNFNTHDGIGPIIASSADNRANLMDPLVIENTCRNQGGTNCLPDELLIQTSEGLRSTFTNFVLPGTFEMARVPVGQVPTATTTGESLIVSEASASGAPNGSRLVLSPTSPAPRLETFPAQYDYYLRFVPAAPHVQDFAQSAPNKLDNNIPHAQNRWVKIELRPEPPRRSDGWYTADVTTGLLDTATVVFDKVIEPGWLLGATVVMGPDENVISQSHIETGRIVFAGDTVKFCLRTFYPSLSTITTSGPVTGYNLRIIYSFENPATREWNGTQGGVDHQLEDRAKPVLANDEPTNIARNAARIIYGYPDFAGAVAVDTVVVWISEDVFEIAEMGYVGQPLQFISMTSYNLFTPTLYLVSVGTPRGRYRELKYVFVDNADNVFVAGDSVRINPAALVTDLEGNVQDAANNRAVSLRIIRYDDNNDWDLPSGNFVGLGVGGMWWTSTQTDATTAWGQDMFSGAEDVLPVQMDKTNGLSVRCVRD